MKRAENKKVQNVLRWFKSTIPLVVVMGLTWIIGLLVVDVEELAPLAYIYSIMVAFQGLFIFIVLVALSKAVRNDYIKWWKSKICNKVSTLQIQCTLTFPNCSDYTNSNFITFIVV